MTGTYDLWLVALSYSIAAIASYVALQLTSHMAVARKGRKNWWLISGAFAMGLGIWSMHFIGMLAFHLPISVSYDVPITLLSMLIAVVVSGFALSTIARARLTPRRLLLSGLLMGAGIGAMHYTGMEAMRMFPSIRYDSVLGAAAVAIAVGASVVALWISFRLRSTYGDARVGNRVMSATVMALAISGMHYTAMAAAHFAEGSFCLGGPQRISNVWLAATITCCTVLFLAGTLLIPSPRPSTGQPSQRLFGIHLKLSASYLLVAIFGAAFALAALLVQFDAAERLAALEAEDVAGVVVGSMGSDPIGNPRGAVAAMADFRETRGRDAFVVDMNRIVVADTDPTEVGTIFSKDEDNVIAAVLNDGRTRTFTEVEGRPGTDLMQLVLPLRQKPRDRASPIVGAIVLEYTQIHDNLLAQARSVAYLIGSIGIAFVFVTSVFGIRVASAIAGPLGELERGARAIAGGQYDARVAVKSEDEIGALANAFNHMAQDLGQSHARLVEHQQELENRVAQRTLEWQQAEAAQRETAAELRLITDHMPAALCYIDRDLRYRYHNKLYAQMYEVDDDIDGRPIADIIGADAFAEVQGYADQVLSGRQVTYERRHQNRGGKIHDMLTTLVPRVGENGTVIGYYGMTQDISERKLGEDAVRRSNEELTQINARLKETQGQLMQAEKMASIGQLASGVAHEINNPIGYVQSNLGTLNRYMSDIFSVLDRYQEAEASIADPAIRADIDSAKQVADLSFIRDDVQTLLAQSKDGVTRVAKIVRDLKNFSRSAAAEAWQWADLHKGIDSTLNIVSNQIKYKAEVIKEYGALPQVQCRPSQLNQVFMNMLVNAAQAIKQQGKIYIRTGTAGDLAWIEFADSGQGIPPEHLGRIFDPFFTSKPVGEGTGLGLSLAYGIVKDHGGRIEVQSVVGEGTTFRIWLPIRQETADQDDVALAEVTACPSPASRSELQPIEKAA